MTKDPIVAEVRKVREAYAKEFNYDLDAIFHDLLEWQKKTGHSYDLPPKRNAKADRTA